MVIVVKETGKIDGNQTILREPGTERYFKVNTIKSPVVDTTFVLNCSPAGKVKDWNEVYECIPGDHAGVVAKLVSGELSIEQLNFIEQSEE